MQHHSLSTKQGSVLVDTYSQCVQSLLSHSCANTAFTEKFLDILLSITVTFAI